MEELNCTHLACPMPILEISKRMKSLKIDDQLLVKATDAGFKLDLEAWAKASGNHIVSFKQEGNILIALIQKKQEK